MQSLSQLEEKVKYLVSLIKKSKQENLQLVAEKEELFLQLEEMEQSLLSASKEKKETLSTVESTVENLLKFIDTSDSLNNIKEK